jgi:hypothetical protein
MSIADELMELLEHRVRVGDCPEVPRDPPLARYLSEMAASAVDLERDDAPVRGSCRDGENVRLAAFA